MVLAPEHELVNLITTADQKQAIEEYQKFTSSRSERERLAETKTISGCFTGAYAIHPFTGKEIPIWISEYVLASYGTVLLWLCLVEMSVIMLLQSTSI